MWKDREDMADSVEYINRLRRELHGCPPPRTEQ